MDVYLWHITRSPLHGRSVWVGGQMDRQTQLAAVP